MKNISNNGYSFLDLKLSSYDYNDLILSSNLNIGCDCNDVIMPISCIVFTGVTSNSSDIIWDKSKSFTGTIEKFGITGYDNRYVNSIDSSLVVDGELNFNLKAVSGDTYCYNILSGSTTPQLNGGFFQGHYKLDGYNYQVLPDFFERGWTIEIELCKLSGSTDCLKPTLNEQFPNNEGIFYFIGTRADNKFCNLNPETIGYEVSSGVTFLESLMDVDKHTTPNKNSFLFWNENNLKEYYLTHTGTTIELPECCEGLAYNMLAFRITPDNKIGYRYLALSGECVEGLYVDDIISVEKYSTETSIIENKDHLITIKYENNHPLNCIPREINYGTLSIYVDGFLKLRDYNFPNIIPYKFDDLSSKQLGVPFNISIGGGTQGRLEGNVFAEENFNLCNYTFCLQQDQKFLGIYIDDIFIEETILYQDYNDIVSFLENNIINYGKISYIKNKNNIEFSLTLVKNVINKIKVESLTEHTNIICCQDIQFPIYEFEPKKTFCFEVNYTDNRCEIIENNFSGTFIGKIYSYCLYNQPLTLSQIKCNYTELYS